MQLTSRKMIDPAALFYGRYTLNQITSLAAAIIYIIPSIQQKPSRIPSLPRKGDEASLPRNKGWEADRVWPQASDGIPTLSILPCRPITMYWWYIYVQ